MRSLIFHIGLLCLSQRKRIFLTTVGEYFSTDIHYIVNRDVRIIHDLFFNKTSMYLCKQIGLSNFLPLILITIVILRYYQ